MSTRARWSAAIARHWLRGCTQLGSNPRLAGKPTIHVDHGQLHIGRRFFLASRPVASHLVAGPGALLRIGDDVSIGCGAAIAAYERVQIGDGTSIGPYAIIMDTNFHGSAGSQSVQHDCQPVIIGKDCRIGSRVTIVRGSVIGDGAEVLAGSVVTSAIPPGACAAGGRARVIGRAGEVTSRSYSAVTLLPDILMASLGLESPPELDERAIPAGLWINSRIQVLIDAIVERTSVGLRPDEMNRVEKFADIAAAVQRATISAGHRK